MPSIGAAGKAAIVQLRCTMLEEVRRPGYPTPAQRPAEVLGTLSHAQLIRTNEQLTLCSFDRHW